MTALCKTTLTLLRSQISVVDNELLLLIKKRCDIIDHIAREKKKGSIAIIQNDRWEIVLKDILKQAKILGLSKALVTDIWEVLHKHSILQQQ